MQVTEAHCSPKTARQTHTEAHSAKKIQWHKEKPFKHLHRKKKVTGAKTFYNRKFQRIEHYLEDREGNMPGAI